MCSETGVWEGTRGARILRKLVKKTAKEQDSKKRGRV